MHQNTLFSTRRGALASARTSTRQERVAVTCNPNQTTSPKGFTPRSLGDHTFQGLRPTASGLMHVFTPTPSKPT